MTLVRKDAKRVKLGLPWPWGASELALYNYLHYRRLSNRSDQLKLDIFRIMRAGLGDWWEIDEYRD